MWTNITPPDPHIEPVPIYSEVQIHPDDPCTVYAAGAGLQRSTDGGATWQLLARETLSIPQRLRIDPKNPKRMLTMQGVHAFGLFPSSDG